MTSYTVTTTVDHDTELVHKTDDFALAYAVFEATVARAAHRNPLARGAEPIEVCLHHGRIVVVHSEVA